MSPATRMLQGDLTRFLSRTSSVCGAARRESRAASRDGDDTMRIGRGRQRSRTSREMLHRGTATEDTTTTSAALPGRTRAARDASKCTSRGARWLPAHDATSRASSSHRHVASRAGAPDRSRLLRRRKTWHMLYISRLQPGDACYPG